MKNKEELFMAKLNKIIINDLNRDLALMGCG